MAQQESVKNISDRLISRTLRFGVWTSSLFMAAGLFAVFLQSGTVQVPEQNPLLTEIFSGLFSKTMLVPGEAETVRLLYAGLVVLMFTPFVRVIAAAIAFGAEKDWKFVGVSLVVLCMLVGELVFSLR